jgi:hypothetical protein
MDPLKQKLNEQASTIRKLEAENERLRAENSRLLGLALTATENASRRTLALALAGALPKPGTPEHDFLGYVAP